MNKEEIAYLAGFFDGEGSVTRQYRKDKQYHVLIFQIGQTDFQVLTWIKNKIGYGSIYARKPKDNRKKFWNYYLNGVSRVLHTLYLIRPYLIVKKDSVDNMISFYEQKAKRHRLTSKAVSSAIA